MRHSHHDLAIAEATEATILADFDGATFTYGGRHLVVFQAGRQVLRQCRLPDGRLADVEIRYVFGATALQQYLIASNYA